MAKEIMEKRKKSKMEPRPGLCSTSRRNDKPMDRISAIMVADEAAGYGCHYGKYVADHPDAFKDWEPDHEMPESTPKVYEITCRGCGQKFTTTQKNRRYCADECKKRKEKAGYIAKKTKKEEMKNV